MAVWRGRLSVCGFRLRISGETQRARGQRHESARNLHLESFVANHDTLRLCIVFVLHGRFGNLVTMEWVSEQLTQLTQQRERERAIENGGSCGTISVGSFVLFCFISFFHFVACL